MSLIFKAQAGFGLKINDQELNRSAPDHGFTKIE